MKQNSDKHINDLKLQVIQMVTQLQNKDDVIQIYEILKGKNYNNRNVQNNKKQNYTSQNQGKTQSYKNSFDMEIKWYLEAFMNGWDYEELLKEKIDNKDIDDYNFMIKHKGLLKKHNEEIKNQRPEPEPQFNYWDYD